MISVSRRTVLGGVAGTTFASAVGAGTPIGRAGARGEQDPASVAARSWIFGYPLISTYLSYRAYTNSLAKRPGEPFKNIAFPRSMPDASPSSTTPVMPNHDTLYMSGWFDLTDGAYRLDLPAMADRYFMMPVLDAWQNVFAEIGSRATGPDARSFLLVGPGWLGHAPADVTVFRSPTDLTHMVGRIYCSGEPEDLKAVNLLQDAIKVTALDQAGAPRSVRAPLADSSVPAGVPVRDQIYAMDAPAYFSLLAMLMARNPPLIADAPIVADMAAIGLVAGRPFKPGEALRREISSGVTAAHAQIIAAEKRLAGTVNGWTVLPDVGKYGRDYERRAANAGISLAVRPDRAQLLHAAGMTYWARDAAYFATETDAVGARLVGDHPYVIRFRPDQLPKADGYWAISAFGPDYFFVPNRLNRFALGARDKFLYNTDGSVDIHVQPESPGGAAEANWLPVPRDKFALMIRIYGPTQPSALADGWLPPYVDRLDVP